MAVRCLSLECHTFHVDHVPRSALNIINRQKHNTHSHYKVILENSIYETMCLHPVIYQLFRLICFFKMLILFSHSLAIFVWRTEKEKNRTFGLSRCTRRCIYKKCKSEKKSRYSQHTRTSSSSSTQTQKSQCLLTVPLQRAPEQDTADSHYAQNSAFGLQEQQKKKRQCVNICLQWALHPRKSKEVTAALDPCSTLSFIYIKTVIYCERHNIKSWHHRFVDLNKTNDFCCILIRFLVSVDSKSYNIWTLILT